MSHNTAITRYISSLKRQSTQDKTIKRLQECTESAHTTNNLIAKKVPQIPGEPDRTSIQHLTLQSRSLTMRTCPSFLQLLNAQPSWEKLTPYQPKLIDYTAVLLFYQQNLGISSPSVSSECPLMTVMLSVTSWGNLRRKVSTVLCRFCSRNEDFSSFTDLHLKSVAAQTGSNLPARAEGSIFLVRRSPVCLESIPSVWPLSHFLHGFVFISWGNRWEKAGFSFLGSDRIRGSAKLKTVSAGNLHCSDTSFHNDA